MFVFILRSHVGLISVIPILFIFPLMFKTNVSYHVSAKMIQIIANRKALSRTRRNIAVF
jgi:hypothetical protein